MYITKRTDMSDKLLIYMRFCTHTHVCRHISMCVYECVCVYKYMYMYVYISKSDVNLKE